MTSAAEICLIQVDMQEPILRDGDEGKAGFFIH